MVPAGTNPLAGYARAMLAALRATTGARALDHLDAVALMEARSRHFQLRFQPGRSPGGRCRFLQAADGPIAIQLARDDDWALLPAWLEDPEPAPTSWAALADAVRPRARWRLLQQGIDLGLAVACPDEGANTSGDATERVAPRVERRRRAPRVLDLSTLWAGPLCGRLLLQAGATVTKLESASRPDGARSGHPAFFAELNAGKVMAVADLRTSTGLLALRQAIAGADIVIESARPRGLRQLGIDAEQMLLEHPHLTWLGITAHGRQAPADMRIGYGDDTGIAAGLSAALHASCGAWEVVGDAIADPLTGLRGAVLAMQSFHDGGGRLLDVSLRGTVRMAMDCAEQALGRAGFLQSLAGWRMDAAC